MVNRELQITYTDAWQNLGTLMRADADYANGQLTFDTPFTLINQGAHSITVKGVENATPPDGGNGLTIESGQFYTWENGFNAATTYIKGLTAAETGSVDLSFTM